MSTYNFDIHWSKLSKVETAPYYTIRIQNSNEVVSSLMQFSIKDKDRFAKAQNRGRSTNKAEVSRKKYKSSQVKSSHSSKKYKMLFYSHERKPSQNKLKSL